MNERALKRLFNSHKKDAEQLLGRPVSISFGMGSPSLFPQVRQIALTELQTGPKARIHFAPKFSLLNEDMAIAVLRHEFGHALAHILGVPFLSEQLGENLDMYYTERGADRIAELIWNEPIFYDYYFLIQNHSSGHRPRPLSLPQ